MKKWFYVELFVAVFFVSCATMKNQSVLMHGMIVDESNSPISGVEIFDGKKMICRTNANGFFEIDASVQDGLEFMTSKSGWETKIFSEPFIDATKLYVYQIHSVEWICTEIEKLLTHDNFNAASVLIDDLDVKYGDKKNALFLKSVVAYRTGEYESAENLLLESGISIEENPYVKKFYEKIGGARWKLQN